MNDQGLSQAQVSTFSIATPTVTTILPMTEGIMDISFVSQSMNYQQECRTTSSCQTQSIADKGLDEIKHNDITESAIESSIPIEKPPKIPKTDDHGNANEIATEERFDNQLDDPAKAGKKRSKTLKKNTKLDAKSKLEKSRQSARECRARKKLRYQYLEDLVCNREKAVIKLREELSMFCDLSRRIEGGDVGDNDRRLLANQAKENNQSESSTVL